VGGEKKLPVFPGASASSVKIKLMFVKKNILKITDGQDELF